MAGFEPAASRIRTVRSGQTELHPDDCGHCDCGRPYRGRDSNPQPLRSERSTSTRLGYRGDWFSDVSGNCGTACFSAVGGTRTRIHLSGAQGPHLSATTAGTARRRERPGSSVGSPASGCPATSGRRACGVRVRAVDREGPAGRAAGGGGRRRSEGSSGSSASASSSSSPPFIEKGRGGFSVLTGAGFPLRAACPGVGNGRAPGAPEARAVHRWKVGCPPVGAEGEARVAIFSA